MSKNKNHVMLKYRYIDTTIEGFKWYTRTTNSLAKIPAISQSYDASLGGFQLTSHKGKANDTN